MGLRSLDLERAGSGKNRRIESTGTCGRVLGLSLEKRRFIS